MYLSDSSILKLFGRFTTVCTVYSRKLELFGRFTKVFTVYYSALKYIFIWEGKMTRVYKLYINNYVLKNIDGCQCTINQITEPYIYL